MKTFCHLSYDNRVYRDASSDAREEDPAILRSDFDHTFQIDLDVYFVLCFDGRLRNTTHPMFAENSHACWQVGKIFLVTTTQIWQFSDGVRMCTAWCLDGRFRSLVGFEQGCGPQRWLVAPGAAS